MELDEASQFFQQQLGAHGEDALLHAGAVAAPGATMEEIDAAEQRAVELVSDVTEDWILATRERAADAWRTWWRQ